MIPYILAYPFIILLSWLPFRILYILSDFLYFILYYIIGYRKKVVYENLCNSFPEKNSSDIEVIAKKFYHHFCDFMVESLKMTTISMEQLRKRVIIKNPELFHDLIKKKRDVIVVTGHYGNWEWLTGVAEMTRYHSMAVYKPLNNKYFDQFFLKTRLRFGTDIVPMRSTLRAILKYKKDNILSLSCFVADQSPMKSEIQYWTTFLNQDTPVYLGVEKIAIQTSQAVVFSVTKKIMRGFYEAESYLLFEDATNTKPGEVTKAHVRKLEEIIREKPEFWLWSHRRWKNKRELQ